MNTKATHQAAILGIGVALVAVVMMVLGVTPDAEAGGRSVGATSSMSTSGKAPINDDFHFGTLKSTGDSGTVPCAEDVSGDGVIGIDDLLLVIECWNKPCADVDGDGTTGIDDLLLVIERWGEVCSG
ncbi:MAG: hypothetical protein MK116_07355 [Phycisphaerales bacterium]|nr:hypothetical protein [Phycisphaerales bacterium]